jgi:cytochrome c553
MQKATSRAGVLEIRAECHYHSGLSRRPGTGRGLELPKKQVITNMKTVAGVAMALLALALFAQPAFAEGNAAAGKDLGYTCLGCHGIEGYRNAYPSYRVPKLGGQKAAYLEIALRGYRAGTRQHPTMEGQAASLSDQDIADVAAYLASIGSETVAAGGTEGASFDKAIACTVCHGQNGISVNAAWPTLAGQHEDYIARVLQQYRDGTRSDPVMGAQAALVAEEDVARLARYFSRLEGLETTKPE